MAVENLPIGELAERAGCTVQIIRHYEKIRLLPEPRRTRGNRRVYSEDQASRLIFIRHSRELGFSLDAIRQLLSFSDHPDQPCGRVDAIARKHLGDVQERLARLQSMERELKLMIRECVGGKVAECRIIEVLADHSKCLADNHPPKNAQNPQ
ncbi:MerR family transcriptional regulator [Pacificispira sp.]|uniref:MerR family transcriptional regulator n=1 Tax=Pacificispira sp. TaxID=2888761 RepID=UPI003BAD355F